MTPRKTRQRHQDSASQSRPATVQASDYESEAFYPPSVATRSNTDLNLSVLRRYYPAIHSILSIAPSAQVYTYSPTTASWNKTDVEGTLFVCQLAPSPLTGTTEHCIVVLNRRGLDNLIIDISSVENVEITIEFLMLGFQPREDEQAQHIEMKIMGFFIHADKHDTREVNCRLIKAKWEEERSARSMIEGYEHSGYNASAKTGSIQRRISFTDLFKQ